MKLKYIYAFVCFLIFSILVIGEARAQQPRGSGRPAKAMSYGSGHSGTLFDVGIYYGQSQATADPSVGNEWKSSTSIYDIKLGYISNEGYYGGVEYSTYTQSTAATLSTTAVDSQTGGGAGVGLGYFASNGFQLRGFYRFNESFGDYKNGTGYQVDGGFSVNMTSNFYLGLSLSHRQISFKDNKFITNFNYWTKKETYPFVTLGFIIN
ncbi:MAG: hypothetical protein H7328_03300 [Bdellovibrio sp.]|nr:hypothetical protein [Bdellovibrio sp.]